MMVLTGDQEDTRQSLRRLFDSGDASPEIAACEWAAAVLDQAGVSPGDQLQAIRTLRQANGDLSLKQAVYIVRQTALRQSV